MLKIVAPARRQRCYGERVVQGTGRVCRSARTTIALIRVFVVSSPLISSSFSCVLPPSVVFLVCMLSDVKARRFVVKVRDECEDGKGHRGLFARESVSCGGEVLLWTQRDVQPTTYYTWPLLSNHGQLSKHFIYDLTFSLSVPTHIHTKNYSA